MNYNIIEKVLFNKIRSLIKNKNQHSAVNSNEKVHSILNLEKLLTINCRIYSICTYMIIKIQIWIKSLNYIKSWWVISEKLSEKPFSLHPTEHWEKNAMQIDSMFLKMVMKPTFVSWYWYIWSMNLALCAQSHSILPIRWVIRFSLGD